MEFQKIVTTSFFTAIWVIFGAFVIGLADKFRQLTEETTPKFVWELITSNVFMFIVIILMIAVPIMYVLTYAFCIKSIWKKK